ncbi:transcription regulator protein [Pseudomonas sp. M47T1]|uniref:MarR family winged helix-turn-helix transcriptional regulator n=1 Tax=Pseudomonas sp. M47T1 TaxID=1179778 RepID=UPI00026075EF|nr:MarR family transcriptional regulator [Pseudomonas sp. M47T1]EIK94826.1 transcription regulator protein [Pseudomonas sp. M47T1]
MAVQCLCTSVRQLARRMTSIYETHLAPHGLSAPQFSILQRLHQLAPVANLEFAAHMGMDRTTLSRGLKPLIAVHWIETVDMPEGTVIDKRSFGLQLTPAGIEKYQASREAWLSAQAETRKALGPVLSDALLATTHEVYEALA